jgi:hypothetical protein
LPVPPWPGCASKLDDFFVQNYQRVSEREGNAIFVLYLGEKIKIMSSYLKSGNSVRVYDYPGKKESEDFTLKDSPVRITEDERNNLPLNPIGMSQMIHKVTLYDFIKSNKDNFKIKNDKNLIVVYGDYVFNNAKIYTEWHLSPEMNYAIVKEVRESSGGGERVFTDIDLSDFSKVGNTYVPKKVVDSLYMNLKDEDHLRLRSLITVNKISEPGDISSLIDSNIPTGSIVIDNKDKTIWRIGPKGERIFDEKLNARTTQKSTQGTFFAAGTGLLALMLAGFFARRLCKERR